MNEAKKPSKRERWRRVAAGFLSFSYLVGAPVTAYGELTSHVISQRFGYSPAFIYLVCAVQVVCGVGVLLRTFAPLSALALNVITVGAIVSHMRIGSPVTAVPAILYTAIQTWFGLETRERAR